MSIQYLKSRCCERVTMLASASFIQAGYSTYTLIKHAVGDSPTDLVSVLGMFSLVYVVFLTVGYVGAMCEMRVPLVIFYVLQSVAVIIVTGCSVAWFIYLCIVDPVFVAYLSTINPSALIILFTFLIVIAIQSVSEAKQLADVLAEPYYSLDSSESEDVIERKSEQADLQSDRSI